MTTDVLYKDSVEGGKHWSLRMRRGTSLRLVDLTGSANVGMLFYNPENLFERYNAPDTPRSRAVDRNRPVDRNRTTGRWCNR